MRIHTARRPEDLKAFPEFAGDVWHHAREFLEKAASDPFADHLQWLEDGGRPWRACRSSCTVTGSAARSSACACRSIRSCRPNCGVGVGVRKPLLAPGLTCANGRNLQTERRYNSDQLVGIYQPGIADGQFDAIVAPSSDLGHVRLKIPLEGNRLKLGSMRGKHDREFHDT